MTATWPQAVQRAGDRVVGERGADHRVEFLREPMLNLQFADRKTADVLPLLPDGSRALWLGPQQPIRA